MELGLIQHSLPHGEFKQAELEGLNLNITVPETISSPSQALLPVLVFLHGGGLSIGCSSWPQYDMANFVKLSIEVGKPVIGVTIKYVWNHRGYPKVFVTDHSSAIELVPWVF